MNDEELELEPETVKQEIEEMIKNHPQLVMQCIIENLNYIVGNVDERLLGSIVVGLTGVEA